MSAVGELLARMFELVLIVLGAWKLFELIGVL